MNAIPAGVSDHDLQLLAGFGKRRSFRTDEEILRVNQSNASLFIVEAGLLHVRRQSPTGRPLLLGRINAGQFFGEISLFDPGPTTASVVAVSDGTLIEIDRDSFAAFTQQNPEASSRLLLGMMSEMARRLRHADEKISDSVFWGGLIR